MFMTCAWSRAGGVTFRPTHMFLQRGSGGAHTHFLRRGSGGAHTHFLQRGSGGAHTHFLQRGSGAPPPTFFATGEWWGPHTFFAGPLSARLGVREGNQMQLVGITTDPFLL
jgi:hypothetical protein